MKLMKMKKGLPIALLAGIIMLVGCESNESVKKNQLNTEQSTIQNVQVQNLKKQQAKEIAIKSFEKYFNINIDEKNLFEEIELLKEGDKYNFKGKDQWSVTWTTFDNNKDIEDMTDAELDKYNEDIRNGIGYSASIDEKNGEIIGIAIIDRNRTCTKEQEIKTEDAKDIVLDYIKKNKLVENEEKLEFLGDIRMDPSLCTIAYKYGENKAISVSVESVSKKVSGFNYDDEEGVKKAIENTKDYKEKGTIG
ncbi:hypothetical protein [Tepidibacter sp. Z1-5]|uniref:hypothetical protein n=1 Tax=Tepidibacter sp. Z1-5 TaxID=3134138 RepID=UPI0030BF90F4